MQPALRPVGEHDLIDPPQAPWPELWDGLVVWKALPRFDHGRVQRRLGTMLDIFDGDDEKDDRWWIANEPDIRFSANRILRPDMAGWLRSRLPAPPAGRIDVRPDWIAEVLSPGHWVDDLRDKASMYLEEQIPYYWLIDPGERLLQAWANAGHRWMVMGAWTDGDKVRIEPFPELELDVGRLFLKKPKPPA